MTVIARILIVLLLSSIEPNLVVFYLPHSICSPMHHGCVHDFLRVICYTPTICAVQRRVWRIMLHRNMLAVFSLRQSDLSPKLDLPSWPCATRVFVSVNTQEISAVLLAQTWLWRQKSICSVFPSHPVQLLEQTASLGFPRGPGLTSAVLGAWSLMLVDGMEGGLENRHPQVMALPVSYTQ